MCSLKLKMHQKRFRLGLHTGPLWGSLRRSSKPPTIRVFAGYYGSAFNSSNPIFNRQCLSESRNYHPVSYIACKGSTSSPPHKQMVAYDVISKPP